MTHDRHALRFLRPEQVRELAEQFGTPLFVYDEKSIEDRYRTMTAPVFPFGYTVRYSIKANASDAILALRRWSTRSHHLRTAGKPTRRRAVAPRTSLRRERVRDRLRGPP